MKKEHHISTIGSVYDQPNIIFFEQYIDYIKQRATEHEEIPDYLIPLNPPPVPILIQDEYNGSFMRHFEAATNYILYAAIACTRLRVNEEIARRSKLRWYSVLADLYDRYKVVVNNLPSLKDGDYKVKEAVELAEEKRKDKLKRKALAKEVMAGRRINKILTALKGQWHVIELYDFITREFLINNDTEFFDKLTRGIQWPEKEFSLHYKRVLNSGSLFQFTLLNDNDNDKDHRKKIGDHEKTNNNDDEDYENEDNDRDHGKKDDDDRDHETNDDEDHEKENDKDHENDDNNDKDHNDDGESNDEDHNDDGESNDEDHNDDGESNDENRRKENDNEDNRKKGDDEDNGKEGDNEDNRKEGDDKDHGKKDDSEDHGSKAKDNEGGDDEKKDDGNHGKKDDEMEEN